MAKAKDRKEQRKIAKERMDILLEKATEKNPRSKEYSELAKKISLKARVPVPHDKRGLFCKKCQTPFNSETVRQRTNTRHKIVEKRCLACGYKQKTPMKAKLSPKKDGNKDIHKRQSPKDNK